MADEPAPLIQLPRDEADDGRASQHGDRSLGPHHMWKHATAVHDASHHGPRRPCDGRRGVNREEPYWRHAENPRERRHHDTESGDEFGSGNSDGRPPAEPAFCAAHACIGVEGQAAQQAEHAPPLTPPKGIPDQIPHPEAQCAPEHERDRGQPILCGKTPREQEHRQRRHRRAEAFDEGRCRNGGETVSEQLSEKRVHAAPRSVRKMAGAKSTAAMMRATMGPSSKAQRKR